MDIDRLAGTRLGNYEIESLLGRGGMGVVYKARQISLNRPVALKILPPTLSSDYSSFVKRSYREAQALAQLRHQNIVHIYDIGQEKGFHFFSMEYIKGQTLDDVLKEKGLLSADEAVKIISQAAQGIEHAHKKDIIHRDIKPSNIILDDKGALKVMDFGLARIADERSKLTQSGTLVGTVDYMSPEQAQGESIDHRTDIWSLGVVLYEMLTGRTPFTAESNAALIHKIIYDDPAEVASLNPNVPRGLGVVLARAMAKNKENRYASVSEFLEDLRNYESLPPKKLAFAEKRGDTRPMEPAKPGASRKRLTVTAIVALLACLCVGGIWLLQRPESVEKPKPSKMEQEIRFCTTSDGVRIAYATMGEGSPVIRVLGWFTHLEYDLEVPHWRHVNEALSSRHLWVRYDGRGIGLSDRQVSDFSLEARVRDLEAVVDALGLKRFSLYGASEGGPTAITYAVRHPERVSHLILFGAYAHMPWFADTEEGREQVDTMLALMRQGWDSDAPAHRQFFTGMFMPDGDAEGIRGFNELQRVSTSAENAVALASTLVDINVTDLLPQVRVPTLVMHLRGDTIVPFEGGRQLATGIPGARFLPLKGRNHAILPNDPAAEVFLKAIQEFLSEDFEAMAKAEPMLEEKVFSSIAVLPFEDMSAAKDQEYFCDGMVEEIVNALTQIKDVRVIARTSAFAFKGRELDIRDIGRTLNVETVLEGSVRKSGNRVRITAQLVDVASGYHLWSEKYDREMKDIFAIQDEITLAIVEKLKAKLSGDEKETLVRRRAVDLEAYDLYLRGRYFWNQLGAERLRKAIDHFERAIEKDPNYAQAYAGLADCYVVLRVENPLLSEEETYAKAREAALKALEIDDTVPEAHASLGLLKMLAWEWQGAEKEYKRAIELSPGFAFAHYNYSWQLMWKGRFDEAIAEINRARELDPLSLLINKQVGVIFLNARRYDEAIEAERRTLEIAPNLPYARSVIAAAYLEKSMYEEALAEYEKENQLYEVWNPVVESWIGVTYARMGKRAEAQKILDDMVERSKEGYVTPTALANLYLELGDYDQGFEWLDKAYEDHDFWVGYLKISPTYDSVRSDPRYIAMLKKMGLDK